MSLDAAAEAYRACGIGGAQSRIERPALVVVDFTLAFTDPASNLVCAVEGPLAVTAELLEVARAAGTPVVFTRIAYTAATAAIATPFLEKIPALAQSLDGSVWAELDARIAAHPDEPVLTKLFASGFFGTSLAAFLTAHGCDGVVITGATTSGCVRATVVDALQHGYRVLVPRDAVADRATAPHTSALFDIGAKYGQVVTTEAAERCLRPAHEKETDQ